MRRSSQVWVALLVALFVALGSLYSLVTPLFEAPDEVWHYLYVKYLADGNGLPVYHQGVTFPMRQEASQPPLYYWLNGRATAWIDTRNADSIVHYNPHASMGLVDVWGNRNVISHTARESIFRGTVLAVHIVRMLSVLMGAGTVWLTYAIARRLFPSPAWLALAAAALNAWIPQFIFINASVNNDVLTILLSALTLWLLVCIVQDGPSPRRLLALGLTLGLAALTKLSALLLLPLVAVLLIALAWRRGKRWAFVGWGLCSGAVTAAVAGWWYVRNWRIYGNPLGLQVMFAALPARAQRPTWAELLHALDGVFKSFWGVFGWFNVVMEPGVYEVFLLCVALSAIGLLWRLYRCVARRDRSQLLRLGLLLLWSATFVLGVVGWTQVSYSQGRLLFPALPALATLLMLGWTQWFPAQRARQIVAIMLGGFLVLACLTPFRYIAPVYAAARPLSAAEKSAISHPLSVSFGGQVRLLGFDVPEAVVRPGSPLRLELYWEGLVPMDKDYSAFVHLVDARGVIIAQRDSYPGAGNNPTRDWPVRQAIRDVWVVNVPSPLLAEGPCHMRVGWYDFADGQRLPPDQPEAATAGLLELPIDLNLEQASTIDQRVYHPFGKVIALSGFAVRPLRARPGDTLSVTLRWQALTQIKANYTVFAQLMRTGAQIWGQNDHAPGGEALPTSQWEKGQVVEDAFEVHVSPDAPEDTYELLIGLYDSATVQRLGLPNGLNVVVLGRIAVRRDEK
jgi:4-amino-4-deoxy-L-arabinose transferase-like glycosyltransferase